ncbi:MAG: histidine--tRNA ligase [Geminicoccaceae bacterium]
MKPLQSVRGTHDVYGDAARHHRYVVETAHRAAEVYGYAEIATPIFEFTEVFARPLGETSDVVSKEMYTLNDRGGEALTLRPENTASVMRAVLSNGLLQQIPLRFFYAGPMFRYERPQKGRLRQFNQIGVELIGAAEPLADAEVIALGYQIMDELAIAGQISIRLNSLGDPASRAAYREQLVAYLNPYKDDLSPDSQDRLGRNPLRILDSKNARDREIIAGAPSMTDALNDDSKRFFDTVQQSLSEQGIPFEIDRNLVRGLDYYTHTAFEFVTEDLGAQGTVLAGGRYDGLMEQLGGPATPGVGWAAGIERLVMLADPPTEPVRPVAIVPMGEEAERACQALAARLRRRHVAVDMAFKGKVNQRMKRANRIEAKFALVIGDDELAKNTVQLRDLDTGDQIELSQNDLMDRLPGA